MIRPISLPPAYSTARHRGLKVLKGYLALRTPTSTELARRRSLVLTDRDREILAAVHLHGFLTADVIERAFFPDLAPGRQSRCSALYHRLRLLWLWRYLDRIVLPAVRGVGGSRPLLYTIGPQAHGAVAAVDGQTHHGSRWYRPRLDRLDDQFLDHNLIAAALWANLHARLTAQLSMGHIHAWTWESERALRARHLRVKDPSRRQTLPFVPDAYFEVEYAPTEERSMAGATGVAPARQQAETLAALRTVEASDYRASRTGLTQCVVVEVDMGTLTLRRFKRKVQAFELALEQGVFAREWGRAEFEVVVVTSSQKRLEHIWQAAHSVVRPERWSWYSFATLEALETTRFGDHVWRTLEDQHVRLLYEQAYRGRTLVVDEANTGQNSTLTASGGSGTDTWWSI